MRIGLIGLGRIGAFHADTLAALDRVDELVVTDPVAAAVDTVTTRIGKATAVGSPEAVLDAGVDGVVIAATTGAHAELLLASAGRGIPTFCEKPIAASAGEAVTVRDRLAGSGVAVQIGYPRRFDPAFVAARDAVRSGELGRITTVRSTTLDPAPPPAAYLAGSGGIFRDCSVHDFDAVRWVTGQEAVEVYAVGAVDPDAAAEFYADNGDYSTVSVLITLADGSHRRGLEQSHQWSRVRRPPRGARCRGCRGRRPRRGPTAALHRARCHLAGRPAAHVLHGPPHRGVPA